MNSNVQQKITLKKVDLSDLRILYKLLKMRNPDTNISHKKMPTFSEHKKFVLSNPYRIWYVIKLDSKKIGSIYLSKQNEIGVFILDSFQDLGVGNIALDLIMKKHPTDRYLANVNPKNKKSAKLFKKNGFKLIQHTYELFMEESENN